jgi:hypothetical protein
MTIVGLACTTSPFDWHELTRGIAFDAQITERSSRVRIARGGNLSRECCSQITPDFPRLNRLAGSHQSMDDRYQIIPADVVSL